MTPLMKMHTLGHDFVPDPIHAGGLRYHGMSPLISHVYELGLIEAMAMPQTRVLRGRRAVRPHRGHRAGAGADPRARRRASGRRCACKETGEEKVILTALCGHGHLDLAAYDAYLSGQMVDEEVSDERFAAVAGRAAGGALTRRDRRRGLLGDPDRLRRDLGRRGAGLVGEPGEELADRQRPAEVVALRGVASHRPQ